MSVKSSKELNSRILLIVFLNYLLPPTIVITILVTNTMFSQEMLYQLLSTGPLYAFAMPFFLGVPFYIKKELNNIYASKQANDQQSLSKSYKRIHLVFIITSLLYGMVAIPICYLNGFDSTRIVFISFFTIAYPPLATPLFFILFNQVIDELFKGTQIASSITIKTKFRIVAVFSTLGGVLLIAISAFFLIWRILFEVEVDLTFGSILFRVLLVVFIVAVLQMAPNIVLANTFTKSFLSLVAISSL